MGKTFALRLVLLIAGVSGSRAPGRMIGYFVGEGSDAQIVSTVYIDARMADAVVSRARAARQVAGTLSGHALGGAPAAGPGYDLLADVLAVVAADEAKVWNETVVARLAELRPGRPYPGRGIRLSPRSGRG
jgi:hypothetical protein